MQGSSAGVDPEFLDARAGLFIVRSPKAAQLGIQPLVLGDVGPRNDTTAWQARQTLQIIY